MACHGCLVALLGVAALLAGGIAPAKAEAAWLGYRNDTKAAVIVQSAIVVNNVVRRGKPYTLNPNQVAWDWVAQANTKIVITVYDAKQPARILYQGPVLAGGTDLFYSVQLEPPAVGPRNMPLPPRAKLTRAKPPALPTVPGIVPNR